ncbi:allantoin permease [Edwardsiella hoshinae]|uniref:Allantoin permease n=1 Tax=Edwardsiella hoshinae TaxID=93378 RepID=A0ABM6EJA5_9GAMM|nr:cytosine permease [Edwardsiella hoshinae]AOV97004.1 allantoin permease [Edwardsiella hoshinae]
MSDTNANSAWQVEEIGIDRVPEAACRSTPSELFWVWSAANIGILGVVYGAIIVSFGLSFIQAILAALLGVLSFCLVGYFSFAGKLGRTSTLTLSRAIFGIRGNIAPTLFSWINLMGWEAVNIITGTLTLAALLQACGLASGHGLTLLCLVLFAGLAIAVSLLGQAAVVAIQRWFTRIFGSMTLIVVGYILFTTPWQAVLAMPAGDWLTAFLPAVSVIAAGTGISWAIAGADYSRYQSANSKNSHIFAAVSGGAALPLCLLMLAGILLSARLPDLAAAENPIALIGSVLPPWMAIPYLLAATAGIVTIAVLSLYSASLNLLTIGVRIRQVWAVTLDAVIVLGIALYILFVAGDFMGPFIAFLLCCGVFLAAWEAIFLVDYVCLRRHQGYRDSQLFDLCGPNGGVRVAPLLCWLFGALGGLMVTRTGFIDGPLAYGVFADSSLGLFVAFLLSLVSYALLIMLGRRA